VENSLSDRLTGLRFILIVTIFLTLGAVVDQFRYALEIQILAVSWKWRLAFIIGGVILAVEIATLLATWTPLSDPITRWANKTTSFFERLEVLRYPILALLLLLLPFLVMGPYGYYFQSVCIRALVFWFILICNSLILKSMRPHWTCTNIFLGLALMQGVLYRIAVFLSKPKCASPHTLSSPVDPVSGPWFGALDTPALASCSMAWNHFWGVVSADEKAQAYVGMVSCTRDVMGVPFLFPGTGILPPTNHDHPRFVGLRSRKTCAHLDRCSGCFSLGRDQ